MAMKWLIRLKLNSIEPLLQMKIIYYSNLIPHLLENSKSDDLLYRGIDLHDKTTFDTNTDKKFL